MENRLILLKSYKKENGRSWSVYKCKCGNEKIIRDDGVKNNSVRSCGCLSHEKKLKNFVTHGQCKNGKTTKEYNAWKSMRARCKNKNVKQFKDYGGRGITYSKKWEIFENFLNDVGFAPDKNLTLDRIDNDGNYEPGNVRWATRKQQQQNRRISKCKQVTR